MKQQFEATLAGSDTPVSGVVQKINFNGFDNAYEFESVDNTLHLIIAKDGDGKWIRLAGTEPYLAEWVTELVEQII